MRFCIGPRGPAVISRLRPAFILNLLQDRAVWIAAALALTGCMPAHEVVESDSSRLPCLTRQAEVPILWYSPAVETDNRSLDQWCRNVGPPVVKPEPTGKFERASSDTIEVLVWNVEVGEGWVTEFVKKEAGLRCAGPNSSLSRDGSHLLFLTQESLRRSNEIPDEVVKGGLLPRVGDGNAHPGSLLDIIQVADQCGLSVFYLPGSRNGAKAFAGLREDKGNAILSTLPLSDLAGIEVPFESVRRAVPVATITTPDGRSFRTASVHLITTPPPWRVVMTGNSARERQSLGLIDGLQKIGREFGDLSVLAAGDLNTFSHRETAFRKLLRYFDASPEPLNEPTRGPVQADHILFRQSDFPGRSPDHIITGSYRRVSELYYSDHYPVRARLALGN